MCLQSKRLPADTTDMLTRAVIPLSILGARTESPAHRDIVR
jgi:hypothetical protein